MSSLLRSARMRVLIAAGVVALVVVNSLPSSGGARPPADDPSIVAYLDAQVADAGYPGASVAVIRDGHVAQLHAVGTADRTRRPVTTDTPFVIGSLSKSLTALAVLRLVDAGDVELEAPIARYVPGFRTGAAAAAPITVRQALDQTSGLPGSAIGLSSPVTTIAAQVASLGSVQPDAAPGARYAYANANYVVLGAVIEAVTGQAYSDAMQALVFGPLGMAHTTADLDTARRLGLGDAHRLWFGIPDDRAPLVRADLAPAGFISSTPGDLARPIEMVLGGGMLDGRRILSSAGVAALTTGGPSTGVGDARYGMGWVDATRNGRRTISHDGSTTDMSAFQVVDPTSGDAVILLADAQAIPYEVFSKIDMIGLGALDQMLGHEPDGTLERLYPIVDVFLIVLVAVMLRGHLRLIGRVRHREGPGPSGGPRRVATIAFHGYLDVIVPILLLVRVPDAMAAPWPVLVRTDVGLVVLVLVAVRLTGGGLRLVGWWRSGRSPVWSPAARGFSGDVRPVG